MNYYVMNYLKLFVLQILSNEYQTSLILRPPVFQVFNLSQGHRGAPSPTLGDAGMLRFLNTNYVHFN